MASTNKVPTLATNLTVEFRMLMAESGAPQRPETGDSGDCHVPTYYIRAAAEWRRIPSVMSRSQYPIQWASSWKPFHCSNACSDQGCGGWLSWNTSSNPETIRADDGMASLPHQLTAAAQWLFKAARILLPWPQPASRCPRAPLSSLTAEDAYVAGRYRPLGLTVSRKSRRPRLRATLFGRALLALTRIAENPVSRVF